MGLFFKNMKRPAVSQSRRATEVVADIDFIDENGGGPGVRLAIVRGQKSPNRRPRRLLSCYAPLANSFLTDLNLQPIVKYDIMIS